MIRPDHEQLQVLQIVARTQPRFVQFLKDWKDQELGLLPQRLQNTAVYQGRCQMIDELIKLFEPTPVGGAKPPARPPSNMHTE